MSRNFEYVVTAKCDICDRDLKGRTWRSFKGDKTSLWSWMAGEHYPDEIHITGPVDICTDCLSQIAQASRDITEPPEPGLPTTPDVNNPLTKG